MTLAADKNFEQGLKLSFSTGSHASLTLDRGNVGADVNVDYGTTRSLALPKNRELKLRIFVDHSLIEVFVDGGQEVLTGRFFAPAGNTYAKMSTGIDYKGSLWQLKDM